MGSRRIRRLGLPEDVTNRLSARGLRVAGDVLFRTDLELMNLLDMPMERVKGTREHISRVICPPCCTVLDMLHISPSHQRLPTLLPTLDEALGGGLPCAFVSELVGPSGAGKSQMCLMLAAMATMPTEIGGLGGRVVLFDTERKFSSTRLLEIARGRFPHVFRNEADCLSLVEGIVVVTPSSFHDLMTRLRALQSVMVRDNVRLILLDSVAALLRTHTAGTGRDRWAVRDDVGQLAVVLKELAEGFGVPVAVTNQVLAMESAAENGGKSGTTWGFQGQGPQHGQVPGQGPGGGDMRWTAALGVKWAHAVNVRLAFQASRATGLRMIHIAKAPMAPPALVPYTITMKGLEELVLKEDQEDDFLEE